MENEKITEENEGNEPPQATDIFEKLRYGDKIRECYATLHSGGIRYKLDENIYNFTEPNQNQFIFRFVFNELNHPYNFQAVRYIPNRSLEPDSRMTAECYALSCYDSEENGTKARISMQKKYPNFHKQAGECLAQVTLDATCGLIGEPNPKNFNHLVFYPSEGIDLSQRVNEIKQVI